MTTVFVPASSAQPLGITAWQVGPTALLLLLLLLLYVAGASV